MTPLPATVVLIVLLLMAAASDVRARRVPNWLNLFVLVVGIAGARSWPVGVAALGDGLAGIAVGFALWFPMYLLRLVGAGDVKLLAASGAWLGGVGVLDASLWTAIAGGLLGVGWIIVRQGAGAAAMALVHAVRTPSQLQLRPLDRRERVPYAVAIAVGVLVAWLHRVDLSAIAVWR